MFGDYATDSLLSATASKPGTLGSASNAPVSRLVLDEIKSQSMVGL